ncbi:MFS transporter [Burkholderia oklahomensis]|uniref:MFS transporter n=1 Tax=Burkholderia oklahomensis TaxID=342113 RepID=UPI000B1E5335|nr:Tetracycline resistance protein, class C [Burkholderia oklahomensis]
MSTPPTQRRAASTDRVSRLPRQIVVVLLTLAVDAIGMGVAAPVLPDLLRAIEYGPANVPLLLGVLMTCAALMQFVFGPLLGTLSDALGRRPVLLAALLGNAVAFLLLASARDFTWLLAGHLLVGATAASTGVATAYLADVTPPSLRAARFGLASGVVGLGLVAGPAFGGLLGTLGPRVPFYAAGALAVCNCVSAVLALPESLPATQRNPVAWRRANPFGSLALVRQDRRFRRLSFAVCCGMMAYGIYLTCFVISNEQRIGWGPKENGMALAMLGLGITLTQSFVLPRLVSRLGERKTAIAGYALFVPAYVCYSVADSPAAVIIAIVLHALALVSDPAVRTMISLLASAGRQGEYQGALVCLMGLAASCAPIAGANLFHFFADPSSPLRLPGAPFLVAAALYVLSLAAVLRSDAGTRTQAQTVPFPPYAREDSHD